MLLLCCVVVLLCCWLNVVTTCGVDPNDATRIRCAVCFSRYNVCAFHQASNAFACCVFFSPPTVPPLHVPRLSCGCCARPHQFAVMCPCARSFFVCYVVTGSTFMPLAFSIPCPLVGLLTRLRTFASLLHKLHCVRFGVSCGSVGLCVPCINNSSRTNVAMFANIAQHPSCLPFTRARVRRIAAANGIRACPLFERTKAKSICLYVGM